MTKPHGVLILLIVLCTPCAFGKIKVEKPVTEYNANPIGIDIAKPRLSWQLISDVNNSLQTAYEIHAADSPELLKGNKKLLWNSGKVTSDQSVNIEYAGPALKSAQRVWWQVRVWDNKGNASAWSEPAYWEMGILSPTEWTAQWISRKEEKGSHPCQYFRKDFSPTKKISSARVYITSLGLYQLFLNGKKVSNDLFTPGWTSYNKRLQYQTYDVSALLGKDNAIGVILGDGWYRGKIGWSSQDGYYGNKLALLFQLQIKYTDGTSETIASNNDWKVTTGPILASGIYDGETYDARLELPGWNQPGFKDNNWEMVEILQHSKDMLTAPQGVPVKAIQEIHPVKIITTPKGETVYDMGQNMVGWVRLNVRGNKGDKVILKFAEVLDKQGNFYTDNLRSAKSTDTYILKGNEEEVFEPHFTFHGFRFVKLEGFPGTPALNNITGVVIHSAMEPTGSFSCSNALINQLQHNIQWGQRGNFLDVPTDCPQRDERLGWTGDAQVFSMTAAYNFNVAPFFTKWTKDIAADQLPNGKVPHVIPDVLKGEGGSTAWADVSIIIPWTVYRVYGDTRILETQYPSMKAWVDYMKNRAGDDYLWTEDGHFGDWLAFASTNSDYTGATTEKDLIATAYFEYSTKLLSKIARIIGRTQDADEYEKLAQKIKNAFIEEYVTPKGRLVSHTQTAYALALSFDLLPEQLKGKAAEYFANDVKKFGHLTTGFVGTPLLCSTLSSIDRDDLAFMLLTRQQYPSWLYPVTQGATTIWERWDGQKPDGTFQDVGMNSFNHYAYGAIGEWLYSHVSGINYDLAYPGYKHILFIPHVGGGLTQATGDFTSMYGKITSSWKLENDVFTYEVSVPANTTATAVLPNATLKDVLINAVPAEKALKDAIKLDGNQLSVELGSGNYKFQYPMPIKK
ncbi:MAG: family 78 glycoside hydrolase catalytic domain [Bacteroidota bacterium]|nr:family 78 glycoside hydrolase catalytic domain [Bacteroidota bacterium]